MVNLKEINWDAVKTLCDKVAGIEERAEALGLKYIFEVAVGIYTCKVYSHLYKRVGDIYCHTDIDFAKYLEFNYFEKQEEFEKHLAEVEELLNGGYNEQVAYEKELEVLNKKYGK